MRRWTIAFLIVLGFTNMAKAQTASFYGKDFAGKPTASGEIFNPQKLTAAHKSLPFGTEVLVRNLTNGKEVVVTINDRGPYVKGRDIDLSRAAAEKIGMIKSGTAKVELIVLT